MYKTTKITMDDIEYTNIDVTSMNYDPETKKISISGVIVDEEFVKRILEECKLGFSIRAIAELSSPKDTINSTNISKLNITSCQLIIEELKFEPKVQIVKIPQSPTKFDLPAEFLDLEINSKKLNQLITDCQAIMREGICVTLDEIKDIETAFENEDLYRIHEVIYGALVKYMLTYGIGLDEASAMLLNNYSKYRENKNNKGE